MAIKVRTSLVRSSSAINTSLVRSGGTVRTSLVRSNSTDIFLLNSFYGREGRELKRKEGSGRKEGRQGRNEGGKSLKEGKEGRRKGKGKEVPSRGYASSTSAKQNAP